VSALSFFLAWLAHPRRVGSLVPSSLALAQAVTADLSFASAPVIELGPGTGALTRSILARGVPEHKLALIECNSAFIPKLRQDYPRASVHRIDATRLHRVELFGGEPAGAVVSGLPLRLMSEDGVSLLLAQAFARLRPDGAFYQFTYGREAPVARPTLDHLGLHAARIGGTIANFPPAIVYRIKRRAACEAANPSRHSA
jgi:phospholipid N-methyltransferase